MNLTMNEQGKVLLNNEPIVDWYTKRNLYPCIMSYVRTGTVQKCCLTGAMAFAHVEDQMTFAQFERKLDIESYDSNPLREITKILGIDHAAMMALEKGYTFDDYKKDIELECLGQAARRELLEGFGHLNPK